jgi:hypothetical protein
MGAADDADRNDGAHANQTRPPEARIPIIVADEPVALVDKQHAQLLLVGERYVGSGGLI